MGGIRFKRFVFVVLTVVLATSACLAQTAPQPSEPENRYKAQEISDNGTPVLMTHLPDYDSVAEKAVFARDVASLRAAAGDRPVLDVIDFEPGTEAVTAVYPAGRLVIIEFPTPQGSVDADAKIQQAVSGNSTIAYRRIGNYNALVFDVTDATAANALLDQVHYQKDVQWLGDAPAKPQRGVTVPQMANVLVSSIVWLVGCGLLALAGGAVVGYLYFRRVVRRREEMATFTDGGGITRLNLDGFTPEISAKRMLGE